MNLKQIKVVHKNSRNRRQRNKIFKICKKGRRKGAECEHKRLIAKVNKLRLGVKRKKKYGGVKNQELLSICKKEEIVLV